MTTPAPASAAELAAFRRACTLAARGAGTVLPNPVVGCVLLADGGEVIGEGYHEHAGGPHAEVVALADAGERARGATAVVTLEPCNHTGRTGPCSRALIEAGVRRVVVAVRDPWPVAAGGIEQLRAAGVEVVDLSAASPKSSSASSAVPARSEGSSPMTLFSVDGAVGEYEARPDWGPEDAVAAAVDVNRVWLGATRAERPYVTVKAAMSLDGRVAAPDGTSKWISSSESRAHAHRMRSQVDTIVAGIGTVLADDPQLTARGPDGSAVGRQPLRVILDSRGRTPAGAKVRDAAAPSLIATVREFGTGRDGRVDLAALLAELYRRGRRHVLVEGGPRVAAAFLDAGLADEVMIYLAPLLLGAGRSSVDGGALTTLSEAHRADVREVCRIGPDLLVRYSLCR